MYLLVLVHLSFNNQVLREIYRTKTGGNSLVLLLVLLPKVVLVEFRLAHIKAARQIDMVVVHKEVSQK